MTGRITALLVLFASSMAYVQAIPKDNIVIGVYTQKYFYGDHMPVDGSMLTYLSPTYANLGSMTGAKIVPIYSYTSRDEILAQLSKVNGVIFTGGQEEININTTWTSNALTVLQYAMQQNDAGRTFPVLGICLGLELMLYLTSNKRVDFLDRIYDQNGVWNTMQFVNNKYYLVDGLSDETLQAMTDPKKTPEGGPMFFYHSNGTLLSTFNNDRDLNTFWDLKATTSKGNQTFVSYLQAKNYPFYITQFHPQRLSFNSTMSNTAFYARGQLAITIALNFAMKCKQSPHRYSKDELTTDLVENFPQFESVRFSDYKVYLFHEWGPGSLRKEGAEGYGFGDVSSWATLMFFVALFGGTTYFLFKKRKEAQAFTQEKDNEVLSPDHNRNNYAEFERNSNNNVNTINQGRY